ncbi:MAG: hypothetical protein IKD95_02205 [Bacteroidales bacterium]|nr:hypothetical protein [Bacteroidales bacterium]
MLKEFIRRLKDRAAYVIADPADNSITFSRGLYKRLRILETGKGKVMVFRLKDDGRYCFTLDIPEEAKDTQLAEVMYNSRYRCVGFESLVPTVNRIFYDYSLPAGAQCKLTTQEVVTDTMKYHIICPPYGKHPR